MIHSLGELPLEAERDFYIYLLDYGWEEPLGQALRENFSRMAQLASSNDAVVIQGTVGSHFEDEVLSWHHVNGEPGDDLLPAIMITTRHPYTFLAAPPRSPRNAGINDDNMILVPLSRVCQTPTEVANLINKIFSDVSAKKALTDFEVVRTMKAGKGRAVVDYS